RRLSIATAFEPEFKLQARLAVTGANSLEQGTQFLTSGLTDDHLQQSVLQIQRQMPQGLSNGSHPQHCRSPMQQENPPPRGGSQVGPRAGDCRSLTPAGASQGDTRTA